MKLFSALMIIVMVCTTACKINNEQEESKTDKAAQQVDPKVKVLMQLAQNLKAAAQEGVEIADEKCEEMAESFKLVLPKTNGDLDGYQWEVSCSKGTQDKDLLFSTTLNRIREETIEGAMWFHIIYNPHLSVEDRDNYGSDTFDDHKAIVSKDAYLWVLINNIEIRAIAEAEDFKNDEKISSVVKKFDLEEIEKL